jgi:transposase
MTQKRKTYTREFKLEAIQLAETSGKPVTQTERILGLGKSQIHRWKRQRWTRFTKRHYKRSR